MQVIPCLQKHCFLKISSTDMKVSCIICILFCFMTFSCEKMDLSELQDTDASQDTDEKKVDTENSENDTTITDYMRFGSKTYPYIPSDWIANEAMKQQWTNGKENFTGVWVAGYIVGYISGTSLKSVVFGVGTKETNIVIADKPDIRDPLSVLPVQLSKSNNANQAVRDALNLSTHPENIYRRVKICADVDTYMNVLGLKNTTSYCWIN